MKKIDELVILNLCKQRLGIRSNVRDEYLKAIIQGIISELTEEKGITLKSTNYRQLMFCVDYACWRYDSKIASSGAIPRYLQLDLNNLFINN